MTTFLLVRHAMCDTVGTSIAGRTPGVHLNAVGRTQATALADRLGRVRPVAIYSSPLERARETAEPLARCCGLEVAVNEAFHEIDFGAWTGRTLAELRETPGWAEFNSFRSGTRIPGGASIGEVQTRVTTELERLRRRHPTARVVVVSHADVLRSAIAYYLGVPLDLAQRIELAPGSVSGLALEPWGPRLLFLNHAGDLPLD